MLTDEIGDESPVRRPRLLVATTGGTIDSKWDPSVDTAVPTPRSVVPEYLQAIGIPYSVEHSSVTMVDSRRFGSAERAQLLSVIEQSTANRVLVSHGTFTMTDSAAFVEHRIRREGLEKTIVFTGSYWPMKGFSRSDGTFALGFSMGRFEALPPGVFVCMSGQAFVPGEVTKILADPRFESIKTAGSDPHAGGRALVLMMGGTIDEQYDGRHESLVPRLHSTIPEYLEMARLNWGVRCSAVTLKDSRHLDEHDRERLAARIEGCEEKFVLVTHGLFRLADTVEFLRERLKGIDKEVVVTGPSCRWTPSSATQDSSSGTPSAGPARSVPASTSG